MRNLDVNLFLVVSLFRSCFSLVVPRIAIPVPSVWNVFGELAQRTGACNLGQGFPDWDPPSFVADSLRKSTHHQYTRSAGFVPLVSLLANRYGSHFDRTVDPLTNVAITVGASQALYLALTTMLEDGDEVVMFDPYFELYAKQVALTKATPVFVPLGGLTSTNPWALDIDALQRLILHDLFLYIVAIITIAIFCFCIAFCFTFYYFLFF